MNVSEYLASQESTLAQRAMADSNAQRRLDWENRLWREHEWLWNMERRAAAACESGIVKMMEAIRPRPFDALISRMEEESRLFRTLSDSASSAIGKMVSDAVKVGETYRRLIDPIPAIRSTLEPLTVARSFDAMRYVTPLVEFERQFKALREHSFFGLDDLRSKMSETILGLSQVVKLATAYAENPPVSFSESYADFSLDNVVDFVGEAIESSADPELLEMTGFLQRIEARLTALELRLSTPSFRDNVTFWLGVIGFLIGVLSLFLQFGQNNRQLSDQKQPSALQSPTLAAPTANDRDDYAGPCP